MSEFKGTAGEWQVRKGKSYHAIATHYEDGSVKSYVAQNVWHKADADLLAASKKMLIALDACETALAPSMANHACAEFNDGRCNECLGCMNFHTWLLVKGAIRIALGGDA